MLKLFCIIVNIKRFQINPKQQFIVKYHGGRIALPEPSDDAFITYFYKERNDD